MNATLYNNRSLLEAFMNNALNELLVNDVNEEFSDEQYHPADNLAFLARLDTNTITEEERHEMLDHLARCASCREGIELMCQCGVLSAEDKPTVETKPGWTTLLRQNAKWLIPLSCCVLLFFGVFFLPHGDPAQLAYNNVQKTLNDDEKHFSLQLTENGYRLSGTSTVKAISTLDDHKREVRSAYETLVEKCPENIDFRTEYGKYLLFVVQDADSARLQLEAALEKSLVPSERKRAPELYQLLGIAAFMDDDHATAQKHFRDALALDPKNVDAKVNLAISLYRNGDREQAFDILRELRTEAISDTLKNKIDTFLDRE